MLPVWLSDLRGACLVLCGCVAADACGLRRRRLLAAVASANAAGLACSIAFYVHTTRTVFNRKVRPSIRPFLAHLMMTRPLEVLWRFATAPLRALPDLQVLGEVRTGTTSLAAHLRELGCIGPFSPWIVPLANDKESFYFAGHYWGFVHPWFYRMCFPLKITLWFRRRVLRRPSPVFDACASHLSTPWTAALMGCATPNAALLALLRPPPEQHASWWKLEMGAQAWARGMGMGEAFLPEGYPPASFRESLDLSRGGTARALYAEGERAGASFRAAVGCRARFSAAFLPERLLPFPGGQLAAFAHMGRYADNLQRFFDQFGAERVVAIETAELVGPGGAAAAVRRLAALLPELGALQDAWEQRSAGGKGPGGQAAAAGATLQQLNAAPEVPAELQPRAEDLAEIREYCRDDNERLFRLLGRDLGWNAAPAPGGRP